MRISWAIPCKFVEVYDGLATIVGGGANVYTLPAGALPQPITVTIAAQLAGSDEDVQQPHHLRGHVLGPDMQPVGEAMDVTDFAFPPGENKPPGWETTIILPIVMHWIVEETGTYTLEFSLDGRSSTVAILVTEEG